MFVIVEGLDRCGKSSLIKQLRSTVFTTPKTLAIHSSSPPKHDPSPSDWELQHYHHLFGQFTYLSEKEGFDVIADRFHLGAYVYGFLFRGLEGKDIFDVESYWLQYVNPLLITLVDEPEAILERDDGDSHESTIEQYTMSKDLFIDAHNYSKIKDKVLINVSENGGFANTLPTVMEKLYDIRG